jgi:PAS domain S-box-containing protein
MSIPLRVLFVEDNEQDLAMLLTHFARSEYRVTHTRVETAEEMTAALRGDPWDLIISDYCLPTFSGSEALQVAQAVGAGYPFLIVSGNIGEETAVAAMKAGAHDYIFKGNVQRLLPAVTRELREAALRREHRLAQQALHQTETRYHHLVEHIPASVYWTDTDHPLAMHYISPQVEDLLGIPYDAIQVNPTLLRDTIHPDDRARAHHHITHAIQSRQSYQVEYRMNRLDEQVVWVIDTADIVSLDDDNPPLVQGILLDITTQKTTEATLRARERQLRMLAAELSTAEDRERRRLATAVHDQISQTLAFARMELRALMTDDGVSALTDHLENVWMHVDRAYQQTKSVTFELCPPILYDLGLAAAVDWLAEHFEGKHGLIVEVETDHDFPALPPEIASVFFRAIRELLTNVVKHAHARHVVIHLHCTSLQVVVYVADDGVGIALNPLETTGAVQPTSFGLFSLRERVQYLGGEMALTSTPGHGTQVMIALPLTSPADAAGQREEVWYESGDRR